MQKVSILCLLGGVLLGVLIGTSLPSLRFLGASTPRQLRAIGSEDQRIANREELQEDLVEKTKVFLKEGTGYYSPFKREWYAEDYVFRGPVIGPFNLDDEEKLLSKAGPYQGFPDIDPGVHACWLDVNVDRLVYCVLYPTGTHTQDWPSPAGLIKASNHSLQSSGEVWSVLWNEQGKVKHQTVGYPINAHRGNGCGFGATFGLTCAAKGGTKLTYDSLVAAFISEWTIGIPREHSKTVPSWWSAYCQGQQCP